MVERRMREAIEGEGGMGGKKKEKRQKSPCFYLESLLVRRSDPATTYQLLFPTA